MSSGVSIFGERTTGQDVRQANVTACLSIANLVKSSLGPQGLDKMLVNELGDVLITNDGATILKQLEVEHPAAKILVELSQLQDQEVGDGTTSVVIVAAELLKRANELVKEKVHPSSVMQGFRLALRESLKFIKDNLVVKVEQLGDEGLLNVAKTSMNSKLVFSESDYFATLIVKAVQNVKVKNEKENKYPIKRIKILKCHGQSLRQSTLIPGYALQMCRSAQGCPTKVLNARIACLDFDLKKYKTQWGVDLRITNPEELEKIRQREMDITKERCQKLIEAGANVILTTKGIDDLALKYFVEKKCFAVRRVPKEDLRRIAKSSGATLLLSLVDENGEDNIKPDQLGSAEEVWEETLGDDDFVFFKNVKGCQTIILRGANTQMVDEIERSLHDSICMVKRVLQSSHVVAGGGAVEVALSVFLEDYARTLGSREQLAISEFAEALLVIPKTLAVNAAQDATELLAKLRAAHWQSQNSGEETKKDWKFVGLDLKNGKIRNNLREGVLEPAISKIKSLRFATEAAVTILRIDDMIKLDKQPKAEEEP